MAIQFPLLKPSSFEFRPAVFNVAAPQFRGSVVTPRLLASLPNSPTLGLDFRNISADSILQVFDAWEASYSGMYELALPEEVVAGIKSVDFAGRIVSAYSTGWRFQEEPRLSRLAAGVGDVGVRLVGELSRRLLAATVSG